MIVGTQCFCELHLRVIYMGRHLLVWFPGCLVYIFLE